MQKRRGQAGPQACAPTPRTNTPGVMWEGKSQFQRRRAVHSRRDLQRTLPAGARPATSPARCPRCPSQPPPLTMPNAPAASSAAVPGAPSSLLRSRCRVPPLPPRARCPQTSHLRSRCRVPPQPPLRVVSGAPAASSRSVPGAPRNLLALGARYLPQPPQRTVPRAFRSSVLASVPPEGPARER